MISAVVLTKNEERNIGECLKTLLWCDEIIIIDDYSEDKTIKNVQKLKCLSAQNKLKIKVFKRHLNNDFAQQRNFGLEKARGEWVFFIDADERVSLVLAKEIKQAIEGKFGNYNGFYLKRWDFWGRRWLNHGEIGSVRLLRLAKRNSGRWERAVHEIWRIKGKIGELKEPLRHYPHPTISELIRQINFYSTLHAYALKKEGKKSSLGRIIFYPMGKFLKNYFLRLGFLDGLPGLIVALTMSFHSFLAQAKLYFLKKDE